MTLDQYNTFDVTIVGAGPCGTILAYELAKRGVKVLILEKEKLPRDIACAGGITVRAASLIPFDVSVVAEDVIYGSRLSYQQKPRAVRKYPQPLAYMVTRSVFDHWLAGQARAAGVTLAEETPVRKIEIQPRGVQVTIDSGTFTTPLLVGADGANSIVVNSLGWRDNFEFGVGLNALINTDAKTLQNWDGLMGLDWGIPGGYGWVFPKHGHIAVGAGGSHRVALKLKTYARGLIKAYGLDHEDNFTLRGRLMPVLKAGRPLSFERGLLVGDAAGMVDPLSGEGIYYGLQGVYLAIEPLMSFLAGKAADLKDYDAAVNRQIIPELMIARKIQKLNTLSPWFVFTMLKNRRRVWSAFCRMLRGEKTYTGVRKSVPPPLRIFFDRL
jgi:geranylgeranyl reductase family protein